MSRPVFAFAEVVDMRKIFDTLGAIVRDPIKQDILDGALFYLSAVYPRVRSSRTPPRR